GPANLLVACACVLSGGFSRRPMQDAVGLIAGLSRSNRSAGPASSARSAHCIGKWRAAHSLNTRVGSRAWAGYTPAPGVARSAMSAVPIAAPTAPRYEAAVVERLRFDS